MERKNLRRPLHSIKAPLCANCGHTVKRHAKWGHTEDYTEWGGEECQSCEARGGYYTRKGDLSSFVPQPCEAYVFSEKAHKALFARK